MKTNLRKIGALALGAVIAIILSACGGGGGSGGGSPTQAPAASAQSAGVAATGAPIVGGNVTLTCASGATASATTASDGTWNVNLKPEDYPCSVKVTGGTVNGVALASPLHSIATAPGTTNVTPLTDLIVGVLNGGNPAALDGASAGALAGAATADKLNAALAQVQASIATLPGNLAIAQGFNPLTGQFAVGDSNDHLLDQYATALQAAGLTQADAVAKATANTPLTSTAYEAAAFTTPGFTTIAMGASINSDGTFGIAIVDPGRGQYATQAKLDATTGNATSLVSQSGQFSGINSFLSNNIGMLCVNNLSQYVYATEGSNANWTPVTDPNELYGRHFTEYEDCAATGTAVVDSNGQYGFNSATGAMSIALMLSRAGLSDGANATVHAKAYKYTSPTGQVKYAILQVESANGQTSATINERGNFVALDIEQDPT